MTVRPAKLLAEGPSKPVYSQLASTTSPQYTGRWKVSVDSEWKEPRPGQPNWMPEKQPMTKLGGATGAP